MHTSRLCRRGSQQLKRHTHYNKDRLRPRLPNFQCLLPYWIWVPQHTTKFLALMYVPQEGITVGLILFEDDNLSPLFLIWADHLDNACSLWQIYWGQRTQHSCLEVDILYIQLFSGSLRRTSIQRYKYPWNWNTFSVLGFGTCKQHEHYTSRNLPKDWSKGHKTIHSCYNPSYKHPPQCCPNYLCHDTLNSHVLMAFPPASEDVHPLPKEILPFLWTKKGD